MTVKIERIHRSARPDYEWIPEPHRPGVTVPSDENVLAMVRHILRERSDCRRIPLVLGASQTSELNEYGHNLFILVQYTDRWRATYAGRLTDSGVTNVQCYMD